VSEKTDGGTIPGKWAMVARGFLAQNVAVGCAFGGFGLTVLPLQDMFGASRGMATLGLALAVLMMGLVSPFVAQLIGRFGLRRTMIVGTLLAATGYGVLAAAPGMTVVLLAYAVFIGPAIAMCGPFPSSVLASNWSRPGGGTSIGIVNTPLFVALIPMVGLIVIRDHGLPAFYLCLATLHLALLPVLLGVVDSPTCAQPAAAAKAHGGMEGASGPALALMGSGLFWVAVIGAGALNAVGITGVSHLVPFVVERGVPTAEAALMLSVMGGASVMGSLTVGWLCGRLGAMRTLAALGLAFALSWSVLLTSSAIAFMVPATLLIGASGAGVFPATNVLLGQNFGAANLPRALGLFGLFTLPLTFCLPPLAGVLRDVSGSYGAVAMSIIAGCVAVGALFLLAQPRTAPAAAVA